MPSSGTVTSIVLSFGFFGEAGAPGELPRDSTGGETEDVEPEGPPAFFIPFPRIGRLAKGRPFEGPETAAIAVLNALYFVSGAFSTLSAAPRRDSIVLASYGLGFRVREPGRTTECKRKHSLQ